MSTNTDDTFWNLVESFLNLANEQTEKLTPDTVNSALQYAAARYNAFIVAANTDDLSGEKDAAVKYLTKHYRDLLIEHLDDYLENPLEKPKEPE